MESIHSILLWLHITYVSIHIVAFHSIDNFKIIQAGFRHLSNSYSNFSNPHFLKLFSTPLSPRLEEGKYFFHCHCNNNYTPSHRLIPKWIVVLIKLIHSHPCSPLFVWTCWLCGNLPPPTTTPTTTGSGTSTRILPFTQFI